MPRAGGNRRHGQFRGGRAEPNHNHADDERRNAERPGNCFRSVDKKVRAPYQQPKATKHEDYCKPKWKIDVHGRNGQASLLLSFSEDSTSFSILRSSDII